MWVITVAIIWPISSSLSHFYERMCEVASTGPNICENLHKTAVISRKYLALAQA
jgi:hypothetical protein